MYTCDVEGAIAGFGDPAAAGPCSGGCGTTGKRGSAAAADGEGVGEGEGAFDGKGAVVGPRLGGSDLDRGAAVEAAAEVCLEGQIIHRDAAGSNG